MGVKFSHLVWQYAQVRAERLLVLLALADWSNEDGECWPSVVQVAEKARISERAAHQILKELAEQGIVGKTAGGGRGVRSHYVINEKTLNPQQGKAVAKPRKRKAPQTLSRVQGLEGGETLNQKPCLRNTDSETVIADVGETLKQDARNPDPDSGAIRNNHHEPSVEPPISLAAAPLTRKQITDLFSKIFTDRYVIAYRGSKYQTKAGDFIQLNAMLDTQEAVLESDWLQAVENYYHSERIPRTLGDLAVNYAEFRLHPLDRFKQPVGAKNGNGRIVGEAAPVAGKYSNLSGHSARTPETKRS